MMFGLDLPYQASERDNMTLPGERQLCWRTRENPASYQTSVSKHRMFPPACILTFRTMSASILAGPFNFSLHLRLLLEQLSTVGGTLTITHTSRLAMMLQQLTLRLGDYAS